MTSSPFDANTVALYNRVVKQLSINLESSDMPVYDSTEQLYAVMNDLFEALAEDDGNIEDFTKSNMVVRIIFEEPDGEILIDGRQPPLEFFLGPRPGKANFEIRVPADVLHEIWMGRERLSSAFFGGQIKAKGNIFRATRKLEGLFREAEALYPTYVNRYGLEPA
jgi:hypothetical protein